MTALQLWARPCLQGLLPLDEAEVDQITAYAATLSDAEAAQHLGDLLDSTSDDVQEFIRGFLARRTELGAEEIETRTYGKAEEVSEKGVMPSPPPALSGNGQSSHQGGTTSSVGPSTNVAAAHQTSDEKAAPPPPYAARVPPGHDTGGFYSGPHSNLVIEAGKLRAKDEQTMQQRLQNLQYQYDIFNSEIEPEHDMDGICTCAIHQYRMMRYSRLGVQETWCKAVMYPGEKFYTDLSMWLAQARNPFIFEPMGSPYGLYTGAMIPGIVSKPVPRYHEQWISSLITLNTRFNNEAQAKIDASEPKESIWGTDENVDVPSAHVEKRTLKAAASTTDSKSANGAPSSSSQGGRPVPAKDKDKGKSSRFGIRRALGIKSSGEKAAEKAAGLCTAILAEEAGRWPDKEYRQIAAAYRAKIGIARKTADMRAHRPTQYLHLLRAGYFEPIPVAWANQVSNPLKFAIESLQGWRGITPAWRGYEDLAEERLYWVLNHRDSDDSDGNGGGGVVTASMRLKPDFISAMHLARQRMESAVEPPPLYFAADDTCHVQHTSAAYSKQVMPPPFQPYDQPESPLDDTMILLDVSGSMDFVPLRPVYDRYLVTGFAESTQPKNKDLAKAIVRRFIDAMENHDNKDSSGGYDLVTFANSAAHLGQVSHRNHDTVWDRIRFGGGTRVMTGWQMVKDLHFRKHSESALHHPVYGWQAGPQTPILRLLLLLDGEATDMDEFELDLLGLSWAHVTIFLIGVDGCPHHHRHANELQRISQVNRHVSFVDAQGNCPERFVTHELLKRHLGYDVSLQEFQHLEELPPYA